MTTDDKFLRPMALRSGQMLDLARRSTPDALERLRASSPQEIAGALQDLPAAQRAEFLELAERVEEIVPLLPPAELALTIRTVGLADAGWLMEFADAEQRVAAVDLDCWKDSRFSPSRLFEWIDALIEAGAESLVAAFDELDAELWVLAMKEMADFSVAGASGEGDTDTMPDGLTEDGIVFYVPRSSAYEDRLREILSTALACSPSHYWRLVYGAVVESRAECESYAARWHAGRLNDLGFPDREIAMDAYRQLRPEAVALAAGEMEGVTDATEGGADSLLPVRLRGTALARALRELSPERASGVLERVLLVANSVAVADELPLAEEETVESSLRKSLRGIERGLAELSRVRGARPAQILSQVAPLDLFRIGATVEPELGRGRTWADALRAEEESDWGEVFELIAEADRTIGEDGRPRR